MGGKVAVNVTMLRDSNLELYRIILMIAIVAHHYVVCSGLMDVLRNEPTSVKSLSFFWLGMWGKTGINCFVLITGYFMCKSKITLKKFLKLFLEIEFYIISIYLIFGLTGYVDLTISIFLVQLLSLFSINDGFVPCFIVFYLFIPFLNILVRGMNKKQHRLLIWLCFITYTIMGTIPKVRVVMNYLEWFCVLYFISSYIRIYGFPYKLSWEKWGEYLLISIVLSMLSVFLMRLVLPFMDQYYFVSDSNHILALLVSICAFMTFKSIRIPYNKIINTVASSVFGVLLIHANSRAMMQWLWKDTINVIGQYKQNNALLYAVVSILLIFFICVVLDQIRIRLIEKPLFGYMESKGIV